jgi:hypothetical protein
VTFGVCVRALAGGILHWTWIAFGSHCLLRPWVWYCYFYHYFSLCARPRSTPLRALDLDDGLGDGRPAGRYFSMGGTEGRAPDLGTRTWTLATTTTTPRHAMPCPGRRAGSCRQTQSTPSVHQHLGLCACMRGCQTPQSVGISKGRELLCRGIGGGGGGCVRPAGGVTSGPLSRLRMSEFERGWVGEGG